MTRGSLLRWGIGVLISAVLVVLAYRGTDGRVIVDTISHAQAGPTVWAIVTMVLSLVLKSWRWILCFEPDDELTVWQSVAAYGIGNASTQAIPSRLGDLVRVYVLGL